MIDAQDHIPKDGSDSLQTALAAREGELQAAYARIDALTSCLSEMVRQFGFCADGGLRHTGGIPALEDAFAALGLSDPHPVNDGEACDEPGCLMRAVVGFPSNEHGFRRTCWDHASPDAAGSSEPLTPEPLQPRVAGAPRRTGMSLLVMQQMLQGSNTRRTS